MWERSGNFFHIFQNINVLWYGKKLYLPTYYKRIVLIGLYVFKYYVCLKPLNTNVVCINKVYTYINIKLCLKYKYLILTNIILVILMY